MSRLTDFMYGTPDTVLEALDQGDLRPELLRACLKNLATRIREQEERLKALEPKRRGPRKQRGQAPVDYLKGENHDD